MPSNEAYTNALAATLGSEGGWYDGSGKQDPNPTMYGVTQGTYAGAGYKGSVKDITQDQLHRIYSGYWSAPKLDVVSLTHPLSAICLFDMSINAGTGTAARLMQRALGCAEDGLIGPKTLDAMDKVTDEALATRVCFERLRYYVNLGKQAKHQPSLAGWCVRVLQFREKWLK